MTHQTRVNVSGEKLTGRGSRMAVFGRRLMIHLLSGSPASCVQQYIAATSATLPAVLLDRSSPLTTMHFVLPLNETRLVFIPEDATSLPEPYVAQVTIKSIK